MSLLAIILIATLIPFVVITLGFIWFFIRSRIAMMTAPPKARANKNHVVYTSPGNISKETAHVVNKFASVNSNLALGYKPTYKPLSHFLESEEEIAIMEDSAAEFESLHDLSAIPGISKEIEQELNNLGYQSVEQIARWGRADVRAVSANLDMDQQTIEEVWVANARLILTLRSTPYTS